MEITKYETLQHIPLHVSSSQPFNSVTRFKIWFIPQNFFMVAHGPCKYRMCCSEVDLPKSNYLERERNTFSKILTNKLQFTSYCNLLLYSLPLERFELCCSSSFSIYIIITVDAGVYIFEQQEQIFHIVITMFSESFAAGENSNVIYINLEGEAWCLHLDQFINDTSCYIQVLLISTFHLQSKYLKICITYFTICNSHFKISEN